MRPDEAGELFGLLAANYPRTRLSDETTDLWLGELRSLDYETGAAAVRALIVRCRFWPSIADLNDQVDVLRQQRLREQRDRERREADVVYDLLPRPPLSEIPAAVELLARFGQQRPPLDQGDYGRCDDCGRDGARYRLGRMLVCASCSARRLMAGVLLAADETNDEAA